MEDSQVGLERITMLSNRDELMHLADGRNLNGFVVAQCAKLSDAAVKAYESSVDV